MITRYFIQNVPRPETEYWNTPTFIDLLNNNANKRKGIFQKAERFPKKYGERVCLNASGYSIDKEVIPSYGSDQICSQIKTSPFHYNIELTKWKTCELKPSPKVPFGRHGNNSLTQKQFNQEIGNSVCWPPPYGNINSNRALNYWCFTFRHHSRDQEDMIHLIMKRKQTKTDMSAWQKEREGM